MLLEACVNSSISALEAQRGGADRVELCENMNDGGCTPSAGAIAVAKKLLTIPVFVMIRPRGADFLYSREEFTIMKEDVKMAAKLGADGVVFGILCPDGTIDVDRMGELIGLARPMGVTCHRAFDMTRDPVEALEMMIRLGVDRILTSGQCDSALPGAPNIRKWIGLAKNRIIIMPGHGIKNYNLDEVIRATGAREFHLHLIRKERSKMEFFREDVKMGHPGHSEAEYVVADREGYREAKKIMSRSGKNDHE